MLASHNNSSTTSKTTPATATATYYETQQQQHQSLQHTGLASIETQRVKRTTAVIKK